MLQAAFGGYHNTITNIISFNDNPTYYEPGFNIMSPLEIESPAADRLYVLIRKRTNSIGDTFTNMTSNTLSVTAVDATNGEPLITRISVNSTHDEWNKNPSTHVPILVQIENQIDFDSPVLRVRTIDCVVKEVSGDEFINFRITVSDDTASFHYIPINRKADADRAVFTSSGREAYVVVNNESDSYILFSPYAWLKETTSDKSDFSYPPGTHYYRRQNTYNKEDFLFSLDSYSHSFIPEQISIMNIPSYGKSGIILVDAMLYNHLVEIGRSASASISVEGKLSGNIDIFKVNFRI